MIPFKGWVSSRRISFFFLPVFLLLLTAFPLLAEDEKWQLVAYDDTARYMVHKPTVQWEDDDVVFWLKSRPRAGGYVSKKVRLSCGNFEFRSEAAMTSPDGRKIERSHEITDRVPLSKEPLLLKCFRLFCGKEEETFFANGNLKERGWIYAPRSGSGPVKVGDWTYWFSNGQKRETLFFRNGKKHGPWIAWDREGRKRKRQVFRDGVSDGLWETWYPNGRRSTETNYRRGRLHGPSVHWDEKGRVTKETWYEEGRPVDPRSVPEGKQVRVPDPAATE